jgi:hypothetical protein
MKPQNTQNMQKGRKNDIGSSFKVFFCVVCVFCGYRVEFEQFVRTLDKPQNTQSTQKGGMGR